MAAEAREMIGLTPSQYKCLKILRVARKPLTEKEVKARWSNVVVPYTSYFRKSTCNFELRALVELGLVERKRNGSRSYEYTIKEE